MQKLDICNIDENKQIHIFNVLLYLCIADIKIIVFNF